MKRYIWAGTIRRLLCCLLAVCLGTSLAFPALAQSSYSYSVQDDADIFPVILPPAIGDLYVDQSGYMGSGTGAAGEASAAGMAALALSELGKPGTFETGGDNDVKYSRWYGMPGAAWCCMFITWLADSCGLLGDGTFVRTAYVPYEYSYLVYQKGFPWTYTATTTQMGGAGYSVRAGDIMFFSETLDEDFTHIGIVVYADEDGWYTVEGNSNDMLTCNYYSRRTAYTPAWLGRIVHVEYPLSSPDEVEGLDRSGLEYLYGNIKYLQKVRDQFGLTPEEPEEEPVKRPEPEETEKPEEAGETPASEPEAPEPAAPAPEAPSLPEPVREEPEPSKETPSQAGHEPDPIVVPYGLPAGDEDPLVIS